MQNADYIWKYIIFSYHNDQNNSSFYNTCVISVFKCRLFMPQIVYLYLNLLCSVYEFRDVEPELM